MSNKNYESHRKATVSKGIPPTLFEVVNKNWPPR